MNNFLKIVESICLENKGKKVAIFVDMDGVIADYRFGEGSSIKKNAKDVYINKRAINTTIDLFRKISNLNIVSLYVLSSCLFLQQEDEKNAWLDKNARFFKKRNRKFAVVGNFEARKERKIELISKTVLSDNIDIIIMVDDTHEILFKAINKFGNKLQPFHVISLID